MISVLAGLLLGTGQGVRHAFEPDHLAAVSTVIAEQRSTRASMAFAATWGFGHALILTAVGGALFALRTEMPARLAGGCELVVGVMLVALGARALQRAKSGQRMVSAHTHDHEDRREHAHEMFESSIVQTNKTKPTRQAKPTSPWAAVRRPLFIGFVHGLAGSGALAALVMAKLPSMTEGLVFMALYGTGAMIGMATLAGVAGAPLARLARRSNGTRMTRVMLGASGVVSLGLGLVWAVLALVAVLPSAFVFR